MIFTSKIENHIVSTHDRKWDRPVNRHWPSEASLVLDNGTIIGKCIREQFFERNYYPYDKEIAARIIRIFKVGKAIEQIEIEHAKGAGIHIDDDVEFKLELDGIIISGRMDALYTDDQGNTICVEYKTGEGFFYEKEVYGRGPKSANPKSEHVLQVMCYLKAHPHIPYGVIFYLNRDKMDTIEHKIELIDDYAVINGVRSAYHIGGMIDRWKKLTSYLESKEIPPPDFTPIYDEDNVDSAYANGKIYKKQYESWLSDGIKPGDNRCTYLCAFRETCCKLLNGEDCDNELRGAILEI
jgi:hypothetical protein